MKVLIPENVQSLVGLRNWLESPNSPKTTDSNELSVSSMARVKEMVQPCPVTSEIDAITTVGAMLGGSEQRFGQDYLIVRCRFAQEYQDPNMPDVVCKLNSQRCVCDLPRTRKSGVSNSVIG